MKVNNVYRVKAFTILELMIAMLISGIVIGITYSSYIIVHKSYLAFKTKNEEMAVITQIDQVLKRDFNRAEMITGGGNMIRIKTTDSTMIAYKFNAAYIIRTSTVNDTFKVNIDHQQLLFEHHIQVVPMDAFDIPPETNRIDELSYEIAYRGEVIPYHYLKAYSSANLIQRKSDAIH